jgi:hypothetical protein
MTLDLTAKLQADAIAAKKELAKNELELPARPTYDIPRLPLNLTDLDDKRLMNLLVKFNRYQDHIAGELALCWINEHSAETQLELTKARHLASTWTGTSGDRVAVQKAEATIDPDVINVDKAHAKFKAKRQLYTVMVESLARDAAVVSREVSRRIGNRDVSNRSDRFSS